MRHPASKPVTAHLSPDLHVALERIQRLFMVSNKSDAIRVAIQIADTIHDLDVATRTMVLTEIFKQRGL